MNIYASHSGTAPDRLLSLLAKPDVGTYTP